VSRFLFVVPPLTGHTNSTIGVASALESRGHEVAWTGYAGALRPLLPAGARLIPVGDDPSADDPVLAAAQARAVGLRGAEALQFLWEDFLLPLGRAMVPGVLAAADHFRPDVLVVDQQAIAGAVVAVRRGVPWATSATTSAELVDPFALLPKVGTWVTSSLSSFSASCGVANFGGDLRFSPQLVLAFSTADLAGPGRAFPPHYRFVGPSLAPRPSSTSTAFPWEWLDPARRHVLVSLGTINAPAGRRFLGEAVAALGSLSDTVQGVVVGPADLGPVPANVVVRDFVPQLDLLRRVDAVVSHGGHNTVCETLAHGLPLVVAPIRDDQPIVAQQVTDAGAAVRVKFGRVRAADLASAIGAVLDEPGYREAAGRLQASFEAAGGPAAAACALEGLVGAGRVA
jgi:UDP:flavonoid glycosyltransferase YjiC (YdhE family)